jgi:hypothetical protein
LITMRKESSPAALATWEANADNGLSTKAAACRAHLSRRGHQVPEQSRVLVLRFRQLRDVFLHGATQQHSRREHTGAIGQRKYCDKLFAMQAATPYPRNHENVHGGHGKSVNSSMLASCHRPSRGTCLSSNATQRSSSCKILASISLRKSLPKMLHQVHKQNQDKTSSEAAASNQTAAGQRAREPINAGRGESRVVDRFLLVGLLGLF